MAESFKAKLGASGKGVLDARAANIAIMTKIEATASLNAYKAEVLRIKTAIANHEDLAINSTTSLRPGGKDFDPKEWVTKDVGLHLSLREATLKYKVVQDWYDRLFPKDEEDDVIPDIKEEV